MSVGNYPNTLNPVSYEAAAAHLSITVFEKAIEKGKLPTRGTHVKKILCFTQLGLFRCAKDLQRIVYDIYKLFRDLGSCCKKSGAKLVLYRLTRIVFLNPLSFACNLAITALRIACAVIGILMPSLAARGLKYIQYLEYAHLSLHGKIRDLLVTPEGRRAFQGLFALVLQIYFEKNEVFQDKLLADPNLVRTTIEAFHKTVGTTIVSMNTMPKVVEHYNRWASTFGAVSANGASSANTNIEADIKMLQTSIDFADYERGALIGRNMSEIIHKLTALVRIAKDFQQHNTPMITTAASILSEGLDGGSLLPVESDAKLAAEVDKKLAACSNKIIDTFDEDIELLSQAHRTYCKVTSPTPSVWIIS